MKVTFIQRNSNSTNGNLSIPVSLIAGVCDSGQVRVGVQCVVCIFHSRRTPAGHWMAGRWRAGPPQTREALELIGDLRLEARLTAQVETKQSQTHMLTKIFHMSHDTRGIGKGEDDT